ncbi:hypothetical protein [Celeribacter marinus]|uniref:hypothetical protein n=1 Tax=Celeribacter marinus TaxID=1397108 RepID=UPI003F6BDCEB
MSDNHIPDDLTPENLDEIATERQRMFTRGFWISLLKGREGLGDTFWAGNYLAGLIYLPIMIVLLTLASFAPIFSPLLSASFVVFGIYLLAVARAVAVAKPKGNSGLFTRALGVIWTLMSAASVIVYAPFVAGQ